MKSIVVTVDDAADINLVAKDLTLNGMTVEQILTSVKVITGRCDESNRAKIESLRGILAVEDELIATTQV